MSKIIEFVSKEEFDSQANLSAFVDHCKNDLTAFGADLDWDADKWVLGFKMPGKNHYHSVSWSNWDTSKSNTGELLQQPLLDFARAFIRYRYALQRKTTIADYITPFRALEHVLRKEHSHITVTALDESHLNQAAQLIKYRYKSNKGYTAGGKLQHIAKFLADKNICRHLRDWRNPIRKRKDEGIRVGPEFDNKRQDKLPSTDTMHMLYKAWQDAVEGRDIVIASTAILLCSNPCRVSEALSLQADCEVERDGQYGLRWYPAKGGEPMIKWVYPAMVEITKEAVSKIKSYSESSRKLAKFYEDHPSGLMFTDEYQHLNSLEWAKLTEVARGLQMKSNSLGVMLSQQGIETKMQSGRVMIRLKSLANSLYEKLPKGFPFLDAQTGLKYSEALFVFPRHFFSVKNATMDSMLQRLTQGALSDGLGNRVEVYTSSIFYRLGYEGAPQEGERLKYIIRSHQFRHLQTTIMLKGGASLLDIALHSGRKDPTQTVSYDHLTSDDIIALGDKCTDGELYNPLHDAASQLPAKVEDGSFLTKDAFLKLNIAAAHSTEYGYCIHDFGLSPCELHRDCINCTEHVCVKGDKAKAERLRFQLKVIEQQLSETEKAIEDGTCGADRWFEKHKQTHTRLKQLVDAMDDDSIGEGTLIQLSGIEEHNPTTAAIAGSKSLTSKTFEQYLIDLIP